MADSLAANDGRGGSAPKKRKSFCVACGLRLGIAEPRWVVGEDEFHDNNRCIRIWIRRQRSTGACITIRPSLAT